MTATILDAAEAEENFKRSSAPKNYQIFSANSLTFLVCTFGAAILVFIAWLLHHEKKLNGKLRAVSHGIISHCSISRLIYGAAVEFHAVNSSSVRPDVFNENPACISQLPVGVCIG